MSAQQYWLMKSEPQTFSIDDLARAKNQSTLWDGVRNYQARNTLRDEMKIGDLAFFYHSSCPVPGIAGIVKITRTGLPDPSAWDPQSPNLDGFAWKLNLLKSLQTYSVWQRSEITLN
jgi:predicted RNA-binding protein with PUA-like domain